MRSNHFTNDSNSGDLRSDPEQQHVPKQINWDRIVYLVILLIIIGVVCYWAFGHFMMVKGYGYVSMPSLQIRAQKDMQITRFWVRPGDTVQINDLLYNYRRYQDNRFADFNIRVDQNKTDWKTDLNDLKNKAYLIRVQLQNLNHKKHITNPSKQISVNGLTLTLQPLTT